MPAEQDDPGLVPIRRSPSGRIPQWVMDEAVGRRVAPAPWRGPTSPIRPTWQAPPPRRRGGTLAGLLVVLAVTVGGTMAVNHFQARATVQAGPAVDAARPSGPVITYAPPVVGATPVPGAPAAPAGPPPGHEESASPLGVPPQVPAMAPGSGYRFLETVASTGKPVTWSPCRPIHYVVRPANQPARGTELLGQAIQATSEATGLRFVADGTTQEGPAADRQSYQPNRYGDRWAPVLFAWATPAEVSDFAGTVAGEAGPVRVATAAGDVTYVSGTVYLDPAKFSDALRADGPGVARALIEHELGHLVGLGHAADTKAIMFPTLTGAVSRYSLGDRVGLAALGRGPCEPHV